MDAFDIVIVDDHSIELVDLLLVPILRAWNYKNPCAQKAVNLSKS